MKSIKRLILSVLGVTTLTAGWVYGDEVQRSRNLGEWSNMIVYERGSSPAMMYTTSKTSPMDSFKRGWKDDMAIDMVEVVAMGVLWRSQVSWATSNPQTKNLAS